MEITDQNMTAFINLAEMSILEFSDSGTASYEHNITDRVSLTLPLVNIENQSKFHSMFYKIALILSDRKLKSGTN